jgi:hypothetical protein
VAFSNRKRIQQNNLNCFLKRPLKLLFESTVNTLILRVSKRQFWSFFWPGFVPQTPVQLGKPLVWWGYRLMLPECGNKSRGWKLKVKCWHCTSSYYFFTTMLLEPVISLFGRNAVLIQGSAIRALHYSKKSTNHHSSLSSTGEREKDIAPVLRRL